MKHVGGSGARARKIRDSGSGGLHATEGAAAVGRVTLPRGCMSDPTASLDKVQPSLP